MAAAEPITYPAPAMKPMIPPTNKWAREYSAFLRLLPELLRTLHGQYVAIHDGQILAKGYDKLAVALEAFGKIGNVPIHVGLVTEEPEPVFRSGVRRVPTISGGAS